MVLVACLGCHKDTSHRVRHARQHNNAPGSTAAPEDEAQPAPPVPTAAVTVPAPAPPPPPPPAPPAAAPTLTVESSTPVPMPPRRASARRVAAAPAPAPEPAARSNDDKPSGSRCEGGGHGERLSVQGVAADDVLNVRESPDKGAAVLGGLPPDATGVRGTSNRRRIGQSVWREVECGKLRGWVNERFLARETGSE